MTPNEAAEVLQDYRKVLEWIGRRLGEAKERALDVQPDQLCYLRGYVAALREVEAFLLQAQALVRAAMQAEEDQGADDFVVPSAVVAALSEPRSGGGVDQR